MTTTLTKWELQRKSGEAYGAWYWAKAHGKPREVIVGHILEYRKYRAMIPTGADEVNDNGNTVYREKHVSQQLQLQSGNATYYDANLPEGWEPHPTWQDAEYFGVWVNRTKRQILTYCEGDRTLVSCPTQEGFDLEYQQMVEGAKPIT